MSIKEHVKSMVKSVILLDKRRNRINASICAIVRNCAIWRCRFLAAIVPVAL